MLLFIVVAFEVIRLHCILNFTKFIFGQYNAKYLLGHTYVLVKFVTLVLNDLLLYHDMIFLSP